jgi:hypothetical protein
MQTISGWCSVARATCSSARSSASLSSEPVLHLGNLPALPLRKTRMADAHELAQLIHIQARIIELRRVAATTSEAYRLATIARFATGNARADPHVAPLVGAPRKGA